MESVYINKMPPSYLIIPEPSASAQMYKMATFSVSEGFIEFYWWFSEKRPIVFRKFGEKGVWLVLTDPSPLIYDSVRQVLDLPASHTINFESLFEHDGSRAIPLSDQLVRDLSGCEWSDYACDRIVISGVVTGGRLRSRSDGFDNTHSCFGNHFEMG